MPSPARNGISKNYTYDLDALECLRELWPARKGQGHYLSSLLRAEHARHEERKKQRERLALLAEDLAD